MQKVCRCLHTQLQYILNQRIYRLLSAILCTPVTHNVSTSDETSNSAAVTWSVQFNQCSEIVRLSAVNRTAAN